MVMQKVYRSAVTGEYVTKEYADANPDTTVSETVEVDEAADSPQPQPNGDVSGDPSPRISDGTRSKGARE